MEAAADIRRSRPLLGTFVEIAVAPAPGEDAAIEAAFAAVAMVHRLMSFHEPDSDVSRLNRDAAAGPVSVHDWTYEVLNIALNVHRRSGGVFDVTVAPALQKLGLLPRVETDRTSPSPFSGRVGVGQAPRNGLAERPHPALPEAGEGNIHLLSDNRVRFAHRDVTIDLGGIAKGFAVDRAVEALCRHGIAAGQVNAGGDLSAFGPRARAVDIRDPRRPEQPMCRIELDNAALASSAGRFDPMRANAASGSAVIDPVTALPAQAVLGATVCAPSCVIADALTKIVMNAGEAAAPVLEHYGASALFVSARGDLHVTADWKNEVRLAA
jgi:thiamine biosynthesis lipoprotein